MLSVFGTTLLFFALAAGESRSDNNAAMEFEKQMNGLQQILGSVFSGRFTLSYSLEEKVSGNQAVSSGDYSFDFRTDSAKYLKDSGVVWARGSNRELVHLPRNTGVQVVNLTREGSQDVPPDSRPPFADFRMLPDLALGNMLLQETYSAARDRYSSSDWSVTLVESDGKHIQFMLVATPQAQSLDQMLDELPSEVRAQVLDLKAKGITIPVKKSEVSLVFDAAVPGLLVGKRIFELSPEGEPTIIGNYSTDWIQFGGFWVPRTIVGEEGPRRLKIGLKWEEINQDFDENAFIETGIPRLNGMELFDLRQPGSPSLGIIGDERIDEAYGRSIWFLIFLLLIPVAVLFFRKISSNRLDC